MPEPKRPLKVFLCHAHADRDAVRKLYIRLTNDGVDAWLDKEKLLPGQDWELEIKKAVREADVVVVCLSKQFNQAGFRQKEVRLALDTAMEKPEGEIFIIPARLEECDNLESLRRWHWVDLFEKDGHARLMRALRLRADKIGAILQFGRNKPAKPGNISAIDFSKLKFPSWGKQAFGIFLSLFVLWVAFSSAEKWMTPIVHWLGEISTSSSTADKPIATDVPSTALAHGSESTPVPTEIMDAKGVSMMLVPAGQFTIGKDGWISDEQPSHVVYLDTFYIDKKEVTNSLYQMCVADGACVRPFYTNLYYVSARANYPVVTVNWSMANDYCQWRGGSLPTEAQWEKAARGEDERTYPWGELAPTVQYANYDGSDAKDVGSYMFVRSPYGVLDVAGNVSEWVSDWYSPEYYQTVLNDSIPNPGGPLTPPYQPSHNYYGRVVRGGSWRTKNIAELSTTYRFRADPASYADDLGFRCAKDTP
ncbi:MAG: SUMF1/EgtB/PvdO family nonheme iron enzyme [Anaerolineales bacterium]